MNKSKSLIKNANTSTLSPEELKAFIAEELAPELEKEWGKRGYRVYLNGKKDVVYAPVCRKCRKVSERYALLLPVSDQVKNVNYIEDIICTDTADYLNDKDYLDFCNCLDEDYYEEMGDQNHNLFEAILGIYDGDDDVYW